MFEPLNTEWNRKTGILPGRGQTSLLGIKHGVAYFTWTDLKGSVVFLLCDEWVLKKHFSFKTKSLEELAKGPLNKLEELQKKKTRFFKYPFEIG